MSRPERRSKTRTPESPEREGALILVVDDEADLVELIQYNLEREGWQVRSASSGIEAIQSVAESPPDLIVLDRMMPGVDGLQVCQQLRSSTRTENIPILMLTARDGNDDIIAGLEAGADDYVTKPFAVNVLIARIQALLRRTARNPEPSQDRVMVAGIVVFPQMHEVRVDGDTIQLTAAEFRALYFLCRRPGWVFTRLQIVEAVHGIDYVVTDRSVDVLMVGLRKKIDPYSDLIETVRGVGYRMKG